MPNIEIHGLPPAEAQDTRYKIFEAFSDKPYVDEMVVTIFSTVVEDKKGDSQPFLRLVSTSQKNTKEIIERLKQFDLDIEDARLKAFYPKTKWH